MKAPLVSDDEGHPPPELGGAGLGVDVRHRALPADGSSSPPRMRTSVDLPAPFGPITQAISLVAT